MTTNHATFIKHLDNGDDDRLYRLSSPIAIYDHSNAVTSYVVVCKLNAPAAAPAVLRPLLGVVAVFAADQYGDQYHVPHLAALPGADGTHGDGLAAIGFPTVVGEPVGTSTLGRASTAQEILEETYAPRGVRRPSFMEYCQAIYPDRVFPQHFEVAAEQVEKLVAGDVTRAQTNSPPQHGSTTLALLSLAYAMGCNPRNRYLYATYDQRRAESLRDQALPILTSQAHYDIFPNYDLAHVSASELVTNQGGYIVFANPGFGGTGHSFDGVVIDDPFRSLEHRLDEDTLARFDSFFGGAILPRCRNSTWVHLINARLGSDWKHADGNWKCLDFPALSPEGLALWPERQSRAELQAKKACCKPYQWELLYQQNVNGFKAVM